VCLCLAVEYQLLGGTLLLFAGEGSLQSLLHKAFSDTCNSAGVHGERCGNRLITPGGSIGIRFEENVGMLDFIGCRFALAYQGIKLLAFLLSQTYDVFLVHFCPCAS
jgi:hypothetical protein